MTDLVEVFLDYFTAATSAHLEHCKLNKNITTHCGPSFSLQCSKWADTCLALTFATQGPQGPEGNALNLHYHHKLTSCSSELKAASESSLLHAKLARYKLGTPINIVYITACCMHACRKWKKAVNPQYRIHVSFPGIIDSKCEDYWDQRAS